MADQGDKTPEQKAAELDKRVAELERMWSQLKWAAAILGTAVLIVTGAGFVQIPRLASEEAVKRVTLIAEDAAKSAAKVEVERRIPEETVRQLDSHKQRAKQAADQAEMSYTRVHDIEGRLAGTTAETLRAEQAKVSKQVDELQKLPKVIASGGVDVDISNAQKGTTRVKTKLPANAQVLLTSRRSDPEWKVCVPVVWDRAEDGFEILVHNIHPHDSTTKVTVYWFVVQ